jgi:hypothetical protein
MILARFARCSSRQLGWVEREPTITEILSDPIVKAVMKADRVDSSALEAQLTRIAQNSTTYGSCNL